MECSFGITGKGYTIIASDSNAARSIVKMKSDVDKQKVLSDHLVMTYSGEPGDTLQFSEWIERNSKLYSIRYVSPVSRITMLFLAGLAILPTQPSSIRCRSNISKAGKEERAGCGYISACVIEDGGKKHSNKHRR